LWYATRRENDLALMKIADGVYRVPARHANTYLAEGDNGLVLIDTGMPGSEKKILSAVSSLGRQPSDIKLVLLTHRHLDHIGSSAAIKKKSSALLASHPFEKPYVAGTLVIITPKAWSLYGRIARRVLAVASSTMKLLRLIKYQPVHVDEAADEESVLDSAGIDGSIVWTPGHTKGSVSLFLNKSRVAIIGDLLTSKHGKLVEPIFMENPSQTKTSVQRILDLDPVTLCPGHGKPLPPSTVRLKERAVRQAKLEPKKEEDVDLEGLAKDLSAES
jgi:glyoxylase-like metal-dependent hydrolase (beta-lactamase superfamily II)